MQKTIALCAGLLAVGLAASAQAQAIAPYYPGTAYPGAMYPGAGPALPAYEIITIVRSTGLEPLSRPLRQGPTYVLRALDPAGQEMRVIADARSGRLIKIVPVAGHYVGPMTPPPYGAAVGRVPDGNGPKSRIAGLPPATPDAPVAAPPPAVAQQAAPPLPRPRPKVAAAEQPPAAPATAATETKETTGAITPSPTSPPPTPAPPADEQAE